MNIGARAVRAISNMDFDLQERRRSLHGETSTVRAPNRWPLLLALLVAVMGFSACRGFAAAQQNPPSQNDVPGGGSVSGTVRDSASATLPGAKVSLSTKGPDSPKPFAVITDSKGAYATSGVAPGTYTVEVEALCFRKVTRQLVIRSRDRVVADFALDPEDNPKCGAVTDNQLALPSVVRQSNAPATASESLAGFNYYDDTKFKPGNVNVAVDPGGYSAAGEVDSYSLMLEYAEAEGATALPDNRRGGTQSGSGQAPAGFELQSTASELNAWSESQFLARGSDLLRHHDLVASIGAFRAGVVRFPDSAKLRTGLGIALSARGDYKNAVASLLRATDIAPSDPRPYFVLAKLYRSSSAPDDEVPKRLQRLVELDSRNPKAFYYYALTLAKGSSGNDAALKQISLLKRALAIDPNFADAHLQLGMVYASLSNYPDAIREYQAAVRLRPDLVAAHYRLAQAYERTGEKAAAQGELDLSERLRKQTSTNPR